VAIRSLPLQSSSLLPIPVLPITSTSLLLTTPNTESMQWIFAPNCASAISSRRSWCLLGAIKSGSESLFFKAGADDCLFKPVDLDELQVRIEALLIRYARRKKQEVSSYVFTGRRVDFGRSELVCNGSKVELSEREARLLRYFIQNRGKTISRSALLQHVWGYRHAPFTRTVDVHILRLRNKIEDNPKDPQFIVTVPGLGYRFDG